MRPSSIFNSVAQVVLFPTWDSGQVSTGLEKLKEETMGFLKLFAVWAVRSDELPEMYLLWFLAGIIYQFGVTLAIFC